MKKYGLNILLTAYNNSKDIEASLQSVYAADWDNLEYCVICADFGSTDGTYDFLLDYAKNYPLAVYSFPNRRKGRTEIAETVRLFGYQNAKSPWNWFMRLRGGDIIYPLLPEIIHEARLKYDDQFPVALVGEADVVDRNGSLIKQTPVLDKERIVNCMAERRQILSHGFMNQMMVAGAGFSGSYQMAQSVANERIWWNKIYSSFGIQNFVYTPVKLGCMRDTVYEDEIDEILLRWNHLIGHIRINQSQKRVNFDDEDGEIAAKQLAYYSLWRSFLLWDMKKKKEAQDCVLLAGMIHKNVMNSTIYSEIRELVFENKIENMKGISEIFNESR